MLFVEIEFNFCMMIFQYLKDMYYQEWGGEEIAACVRLKQNSDTWQNHARLAQATSTYLEKGQLANSSEDRGGILVQAARTLDDCLKKKSELYRLPDVFMKQCLQV